MTAIKNHEFMMRMRFNDSYLIDPTNSIYDRDKEESRWFESDGIIGTNRSTRMSFSNDKGIISFNMWLDHSKDVADRITSIFNKNERDIICKYLYKEALYQQYNGCKMDRYSDYGILFAKADYIFMLVSRLSHKDFSYMDNLFKKQETTVEKPAENNNVDDKDNDSTYGFIYPFILGCCLSAFVAFLLL